MQKSDNNQRFEVKFVKDGAYLEEAKVLRHKVFFKSAGRDQDDFDKFCEHIVIIDKQTSNIVGTYRLLLKSVADKKVGFYSETEFDISNIKKNCSGEFLELGRACVDEAYRGYPIINIMWRQILYYIDKNNVNFIFGCVSIEDPNPEKIGKIVGFFKEKYLCPAEFKAYPREDKRYPYLENTGTYNRKEIFELIPSLAKGYLRMGAFVSEDPVWDKVFNTADFFMILDIEKINTYFKNKFL